MVDGSDEAIVNELETVLGDIKTGGEMIMRWRVNIERLRVALREDLKNGPSREALRELAGLGWEK